MMELPAYTWQPEDASDQKGLFDHLREAYKSGIEEFLDWLFGLHVTNGR